MIPYYNITEIKKKYSDDKALAIISAWLASPSVPKRQGFANPITILEEGVPLLPFPSYYQGMQSDFTSTSRPVLAVNGRVYQHTLLFTFAEALIWILITQDLLVLQSFYGSQPLQRSDTDSSRYGYLKDAANSLYGQPIEIPQTLQGISEDIQVRSPFVLHQDQVYRLETAKLRGRRNRTFAWMNWTPQPQIDRILLKSDDGLPNHRRRQRWISARDRGSSPKFITPIHDVERADQFAHTLLGRAKLTALSPNLLSDAYPYSPNRLVLSQSLTGNPFIDTAIVFWADRNRFVQDERIWQLRGASRNFENVIRTNAAEILLKIMPSQLSDFLRRLKHKKALVSYRFL